MPRLDQARIYASPDPLFAKLPKMQTPIAKRSESTICAFLPKNKNVKPKCKTVGVALRGRGLKKWAKNLAL
jgi:hypothetical protein